MMSAPVADQQNHFQPAKTHLHQQHQQNNQALQGDSKQETQTEDNSIKAEPVVVKEEYNQAEQAGPGTDVPSTSQLQSATQQLGGDQSANGDASRQQNSAALCTGQPSSSQPGSINAPEQEESAAHGKQVSTSDVQKVQNYIEKCLQMYLSQKEVIMQLQQQFKIEPCFTQLVWQKLEEQNQEFFRAYYTRLKLKDQIILFNHLLDEQVKMFQRMPRGGQMMPACREVLLLKHETFAAGNWKRDELMATSKGNLTNGMQTAQPRPGVAQGFPQQMGQGATPASMPQQPEMLSQISQPPTSTGYAGQPAAEPSQQAAQLNADPNQLHMAEFVGMGMDGASADLPPDLAGISQSLPFSGSEINLAGMVSLGSPGRGILGGAGDHVDLSGLPRNFSLSDLALDQVNEGDHGLPRNISLSDLPALDLDSGGEQG